jgi:hypothetical protein
MSSVSNCSENDSREAEVGAARHLAERVLAAERVGMRGADEAAGIAPLGLLHFVVDEAASLEARVAHRFGARQHGGIDARDVHHLDVRVEIVQQRVEDVGGHAVLVIIQGLAVDRLVLEQLLGRVVMLEVDDHGILRSGVVPPF